MSDKEHILDLIERFNFSIDKNIQRSSLEVLATYGNKGIDAITELLYSNPNNDLGAYGLNIIIQVRETI